MEVALVAKVESLNSLPLPAPADCTVQTRAVRLVAQCFIMDSQNDERGRPTS
jgi:hypothetical protein